MANDTVTVNLSPAECLDRATAFMIERGLSVESRTETSITFVRRGMPDWGIGCALMVLFIVPGLLYMAFAQGTQYRTTIAAVPTRDGTILSFSSEEFFMRYAMRDFYESLSPQSAEPGNKGRDPDVPQLREKEQSQRVEEARKQARWHPHPDD